MAFLGRVDVLKVDDKGRLAIPAKFRPQFGADAAYLTSGADPCITVYTKGTFDEAAASVLAIPANSVEGREGRRKFFGDASDLVPDAQGRVNVPVSLLAHAGIERGADVLIIGAGDWFEIWSPAQRARWAESLGEGA